MNSKIWQCVASGLLMSGLAACGGGSDSATSSSAATPTGMVSLMLSDDASEDWATVGVKVLSIALVPQGGGNNVTVYTAPAVPPMLNLAELDQISEVLGNVSVPVGTYTAAVLTISANKGDVLLTASADPEAGFAGTPGATVDTNDIRIQGAQGTAGNLTTAVTVSFQNALVVSSTQGNALDLEFDLDHPAFIVGHTTVVGGTKWVVNFNGPVRHHRIADVARLTLRHMYGSVITVSSDNTSITIAKQLPTLPVQTPETATATALSLQVSADAANGTLFYDVDAKTVVTIHDFSTEAASLVGKYVRVAARYQSNGTLVATRIWASTDFNKIWVSPEGHVLHVDAPNNQIVVLNESGIGVPLKVNSSTTFVSGATLLGTGTAFLSNHQLVRGFKVHASVVDPLATPLVAQTIDIENAVYGGKISGADSLGFSYHRAFRTSSDDYDYSLDYIASTTANGKDANGNTINGFKYWDFAYPTAVTSGGNAISSFVSATSSNASFAAYGVTRATWGDGASNTTGWYAPYVVLMPTPLPLSTIASGLAGGAFTMTLPDTSSATIDVSNTSGSATLVYQVDRTNGVVTVSPIDITTSAGMNTLSAALIAGTKVRVAGVPQSDSTLRAYVLTYFTGDQPSQ